MLERSRRAFQWEQQGMKHEEGILIYTNAHARTHARKHACTHKYTHTLNIDTHTLNTASGTDQFFLTKIRQKRLKNAGMCCLVWVHMQAVCTIHSSSSEVFFSTFPLFSSHTKSRPVGLQLGPPNLHSAAYCRLWSKSPCSMLARHCLLLADRTVVECSWYSRLCVFVFESVDVMLPSVPGSSTDSAAELSLVPNFAQRRPPDLPVRKDKRMNTFFPQILSK